ncbi:MULTISPECIES: hypothetical protein [Methylobacteriaceae]|uniref:hypothetical protein n=1 Tax=Methylobacteriaceae TaxID=119045 RepID=UPI001168C1F6|nr:MULTISPECIES: hypothetical protein [Methylobacteriaceae]GEL44427.1 hypothetical protein MEX01_50180 [Methylorubrum extorquens]
MAARTPAGEKGADSRIQCDNAWYWVRLITRAALAREGACMEHCVGDGDFDSLSGAEDLTDDAVWSLRDELGVSRLTAQVEDGRVTRALGHLNHQVAKGAALQCRHLVAAFRSAGADLSFCHTTKVVLAPDGQTYRRDRVPPEVEAALDDADQAHQAVTLADLVMMQVSQSLVGIIASVDTQNGRVFMSRPRRIASGGSRLLAAYRRARDAGDAGDAFDIRHVIGGSNDFPGPGGGARP